MFEITKAHVQQLNDADLRELVGRLCVAEVERKGISPKCVVYDGKSSHRHLVNQHTKVANAQNEQEQISLI